MTAKLVGWTSTRGSVLTSFPDSQTHTGEKEQLNLDETDLDMDDG